VSSVCVTGLRSRFGLCPNSRSMPSSYSNLFSLLSLAEELPPLSPQREVTILVTFANSRCPEIKYSHRLLYLLLDVCIEEPYLDLLLTTTCFYPFLETSSANQPCSSILNTTSPYLLQCVIYKYIRNSIQMKEFQSFAIFIYILYIIVV
jgi:hypothetical protein